ncbi:MAG: hypothetical protein GX317_02835, partial [Staphylococcus equorum]|nr:hypothetical protein [Staphylococcus equorum]
DVANALNMVIYQRLIDYKGTRVLIYEKIIATTAIKNVIRHGNFNQLEHTIASDAKCESMDRVILDRLDRKMVDFASVEAYITDKKLFEMRGYGK